MTPAAPPPGSGSSILAGAAGLVADAVESALAAALEGLRTPSPAEGAPSSPPPAPPAGAGAGTPLRRHAVPSPAAALGAARRPAEAATDLAASLAARFARVTFERLDLNAIIDRVDVGRVLAKVDIDAILGRVDLDSLLGKVDVDQLVQRLDMAALAKEAMDGIDVGEVIRESTMSIGGETVEALRDQATRADNIVARVVDRALGRTGP